MIIDLCLQTSKHEATSQFTAPGLHWAVLPRIIIIILLLQTLQKDKNLSIIEQYEIYKHYKQSQTSVLNDQLYYKTHTVFNTITHVSHTSNSANSILSSEKKPESQSIL